MEIGGPVLWRAGQEKECQRPGTSGAEGGGRASGREGQGCQGTGRGTTYRGRIHWEAQVVARERAPRSARGPWADTGGPQEVDGGCVEPGEAQHAWPGSRRAGRAERVEGRSRKPARGPPRAPRPPRPSSRCLPRPRSPPRAARPAPAALLAPARLRPLRPPGSAGGAGGG